MAGQRFLDRLDVLAADRLNGLGALVRFNRGKALMRRGDPGEFALLITDGRVKVMGSAPSGTEVILDFGWPGDIYGEMGVLRKEPRMADVIALANGAARHIGATEFRQFLKDFPDAREQAMLMTMERLMTANQHRVDGRPDGNALARVAHWLVELVEMSRRPGPDGWVIDLPISNKELAQFVPVSDSSLDDALHRLRVKNMIKTGRQRTTIVTDLDGLRALVTKPRKIAR